MRSKNERSIFIANKFKDKNKLENEMAHQVFISHTERDVEYCDIFDRACARAGIRAFRSEFETIEAPAWKTIKNEMTKSCAMFLLIGKELVRFQESYDPNWRYTQNWIAYEIGLACQLNIDVWVICDDVRINFPVPYFNNYLPFPFSLRNNESFKYMRGVLECYNAGSRFSYPHVDSDGFSIGTCCPYEGCSIKFNLHATLQPGEAILCPCCLKEITYPEGFP